MSDDQSEWLGGLFEKGVTNEPAPHEDARIYDQLAVYFEQLEEALEYDRTRQLSATWGIVKGVVGAGSFIAASAITSWLKLNWWMGAAVWIVAFLAIFMAMSEYTERGEKADLDRLSRLPKWAAFVQRRYR